jgi:hypothetical protein
MISRYWRLSMVGVVWSVVSFPSGVEASVSRGSRVGIRAADFNMYGVNNDLGMINYSAEYRPGGHLGAGQSTHQRVREAGVGWVRYWINWQAVEPANGQYNWAQTDHDIDAAVDQGLSVYVTIMGAPAWPHGGKPTYHWGQCDGPLPGADFDGSRFGCGPPNTAHAYAPFDPGGGLGQSYYWRRFVYQAVRRYADRVKYWGFWNESGNQWFWPEYAEPPSYSRGRQLIEKVIRPGRDAALAANPSAVIVGPEENDPDALEWYLRAEQQTLPGGIGPYGRLFDVIAIHAYDRSRGGLAGVLTAFKSKIDQAHPREVWLTETNGDIHLQSALDQFMWRGWLSRIFIYRMRDNAPCGFGLMDVNGNLCGAYRVLQSHIAANPPAVHFAGATGAADHDDFLLLHNPHAVDTFAILTFSDANGASRQVSRWMPAGSRQTVHVRSTGWWGVEQSVTVAPSVPSLPIWAEHADYWRATPAGAEAGRLSQGSAERRDTWYFAEGVAAGSWVHDNTVYNPSATTAVTVTWTFLNDGGATREAAYVIPPRGSRRVRVNEVPGIAPGHATIVSGRWSGGPLSGAPAPIVAERTIVWGHAIDGHSARGAPWPATAWYFAEGSQGGPWATYLLLANPTFSTATVQVQYLLETGATSPLTWSIAPRSRVTVSPGVTGSFGIVVRAIGPSPVPIVAERAQYYGPGWTVGTVTEGAPTTSQRWLFPEGSTEGGRYYDPYFLLANPGLVAAMVQVIYRRSDGLVFEDLVLVPPERRLTISPWSLPALRDHAFSTELVVLGGVTGTPPGIVAERAMYWSGATGWLSGHVGLGMT